MKRVREVEEVEEEEEGRRVRRRVEEARNSFSRNQQSLQKLMEENERIAEDIVEDLEEKVDELTDSLEEKNMELENKDKLLRKQDQAVLDLKESHREEMIDLKVKLNQNLCKGMDAELFNKEIISTLNPDLVQAVLTSVEQAKHILELEEKLKIADEKEQRRDEQKKEQAKVKGKATETLKRLRGMNVTMVKTAEKPIETKKTEKAMKPGLNMFNIQAALNLMNAAKNNSGKRELEKENDIDGDRSAKTLKLDENPAEPTVTLNEDEFEEEDEDQPDEDDHDEEEDHEDEDEEEEEMILDPFWFCGRPSSELLRRKEEERLARKRDEEKKKEKEEIEMEMEMKEKEIEMKEKLFRELGDGGCAPCFKGWVHFCPEDILTF